MTGAGCAFRARALRQLSSKIPATQVLLQLNTDFSTKGMDSQELQAVVAAWQSGPISRDTMFELFRKGEILPDGRTNEDETLLINSTPPSDYQPSTSIQAALINPAPPA